MKSNLFYVYENTSKVDRRECGYHDRTTALCVLEYLLDKLYGTGKPSFSMT